MLGTGAEAVREGWSAPPLARTNGAVRFNRAVARENGNPRWTYQPGETVTFRFEYEVLQAVPNPALLFRLYLPRIRISSRTLARC
jgi:hypothetical protein